MKKPWITVSISILLLLGIGMLVYVYLPIGEVDPDTGERQTLSDLFPVAGGGGSGDNSGGASGGGEGEDRGTTTTDRGAGQTDTRPVPALRQLSDEPVAGAVVVTAEREAGTSTEKYPEVRFMTRGQGHIRAMPLDAQGEQTLVTETTPRIQRAFWSPTGDEVMFQRLQGEQIETRHLSFTAPAPEATSTEARNVQTRIVRAPIRDIAVHPSDSKFATIEVLGTGSSVTIRDLREGTETLVYGSQLQEWILAWPTPSTLTLGTKPAYEVPANLFTLPTHHSERLTKALEGRGMTTLMSPSGQYILYRETSEGGRRESFVHDTKSGNTESVSARALPDKCIWSEGEKHLYCGVPKRFPAGQYPDAWYQGKVLFEDQLQRINLNTGSASTLTTLTQEAGAEIDAVNLVLSPEEDYLVFINKRDGTLWSYRLPSSDPVNPDEGDPEAESNTIDEPDVDTSEDREREEGGRLFF